MRIHSRTISLTALTFLIAFSALADTTVICVSKERMDRAMGLVKGKFYSTMSFDSAGRLTYWNEYLNWKKTFSKIERSKHSEGLLNIEAENNDNSFISLHIQTQSNKYIDELPAGSKVKTWFSLAMPAEGEFLEEPSLSETADCTVQ